MNERKGRVTSHNEDEESSPSYKPSSASSDEILRWQRLLSSTTRFSNHLSATSEVVAAGLSCQLLLSSSNALLKEEVSTVETHPFLHHQLQL